MTGSSGKIDHLGIAVRSIDQALEFYRDQLGLTVSLRETVAVEKVHAAMLPVGESRIELLEASQPDSVIAKFKTAGARLLNEPRIGAGGHLYVFIHPASTGGVLMELIQE
jgi:catechol 2,3-dioxygenase-like lactoylglutathione lyase family enzyme